jgi:hypothetical protein
MIENTGHCARRLNRSDNVLTGLTLGWRPLNLLGNPRRLAIYSSRGDALPFNTRPIAGRFIPTSWRFITFFNEARIRAVFLKNAKAPTQGEATLGTAQRSRGALNSSKKGGSLESRERD